jgi:hypothetical protein
MNRVLLQIEKKIFERKKSEREREREREQRAARI